MRNCFICLEKYKIMVPLHACLGEDPKHAKLSMAQVLQNLHLLTLSDIENHHQFLCFICAAKIQSFFEFKILCVERENAMQIITNNGVSNSTISSSIPTIKSENIYGDNFEKIDEEIPIVNDNFQRSIVDDSLKNQKIVKKRKVDDSVDSSEESTTKFCVKSEIDVDEGIFGVKEKSLEAEENPATQKGNKEVEGGPFVCCICQKGFKLKKHLNEHFVTHTGENPFVCDICEKSFSTHILLFKHSMTHTEERTYTCHVCEESFTEASSLVSHKLIHTTEKSFVCNICSKQFSHRSKLKSHQLTHTDIDRYVCDVCNNPYATSYSLMKHKMLHSGEKPYVCDICNKSFAISSYLSKHKLVHVKPYVCDVCNKSFSSTKYLNDHKIHHNVASTSTN